MINKNHHFQVAKSLEDDAVFLTIDGEEYEMSSDLAKDLGDALYKTGCDAAANKERS